jgi:hypothetical protein
MSRGQQKRPTGKPRNTRSPVPPPPDPVSPDPTDPRYDPLTPLEEKFVCEYLLHFKAARAYRTVCPHVSRASSWVLGHRLLRKVNVRAEIEAQRRENWKQARITAVRVLRHAAYILYADLAECYDASNNLRPVREIPEGTRKALRSVETRTRQIARGTGRGRTVVREERHRYTLTNKSVALKYLFEHLSLKQDLPAIDVVLSVLPPEMAEVVRRAIVERTDGSPPTQKTNDLSCVIPRP